MKKLIALGLSVIVASLCVLTFSGCGKEKSPYEKMKEIEAKKKQKKKKTTNNNDIISLKFEQRKESRKECRFLQRHFVDICSVAFRYDSLSLYVY